MVSTSNQLTTYLYRRFYSHYVCYDDYLSTLHIKYLEIKNFLYNFISDIFQLWTNFNFFAEEKFPTKQLLKVFFKFKIDNFTRKSKDSIVHPYSKFSTCFDQGVQRTKTFAKKQNFAKVYYRISKSLSRNLYIV